MPKGPKLEPKGWARCGVSEPPSGASSPPPHQKEVRMGESGAERQPPEGFPAFYYSRRPFMALEIAWFVAGFISDQKLQDS